MSSYDIFDWQDREPVMLQLEEEYDGEPSGAIIRGKYNYIAYDGNLKQAWANGIGCVLIHEASLNKLNLDTTKTATDFAIVGLLMI